MRHLWIVLIALAAMSGVACTRPQSEDERARALAVRVLAGSLGYPRSSVLGVAAGEDAAEVRLSTEAPLEQVAPWMREALRLNGWELRSDATGRDGSITIYAEKGRRPLWITLRANVGAPGTTYTMMGAVVDSDTAAAAPPRDTVR
jgi:hypothetical protein